MSLSRVHHDGALQVATTFPTPLVPVMILLRQLDRDKLVMEMDLG